MGLKIDALSCAARRLTKCKTFRGVTPPQVLPKNIKPDELVYLGHSAAPKALNKSEILAKYCDEHLLMNEDVINCFKEAEKHLDEASVERLLKLTKEGKILYTHRLKKRK